jgi:hypothetical protein
MIKTLKESGENRPMNFERALNEIEYYANILQGFIDDSGPDSDLLKEHTQKYLRELKIALSRIKSGYDIAMYQKEHDSDSGSLDNESVTESAGGSVYRVLNTLHGTIYEDSDIVDDFGGQELVPYKNGIDEAIGDTDLAEYLNEPLSSVIKSIKIGTTIIGNRLYGIATVTASGELDDAEKSELLSYLEGQYSDGWGEGFEQQELYQHVEEVDDTEEEEDPDTGEYYTGTHDANVCLNVHFWQRNNFNIWFAI